MNGPTTERPSRSPGIPPECLELLACPLDGGRLRLASEDALVSEGGRIYPIVNGVPLLLEESVLPGDVRAREVRASFESQWRIFGDETRIFGKTREEMRELLTGPRMGSAIGAGFYPGRRVLDAGCGHARYVTELARLGSVVVGLDVGSQLHHALLPADVRDQALLVQGDVRRPPLREGMFDLVFCDGVLHHTPDPRDSFLALARLVAPGGAFYVWVYPRGGKLWEGANRALRALTTRLPHGLQVLAANLLVPLLLLVPTYSGTRPGKASYRQCAQVIFDWISPRLQSHHSTEEVVGWFLEAGFERHEILPVPTGVIGWRDAP
jgi:SAM-dependent methyltransferase